jgi:sugar-specific transcriptional regulator TrmB
MPNEIRSLVNIGLSEKEAIVYIALNKLGEATAYKVSKKTQLKEPTVYVVLESLKNKDLVLSVLDSKKKVFISVELDRYLSNLHESLITARKVSDDLKNKRNKDEKPKVIFFDGIDEVRKAVWFELEELIGDTLYQTYGEIDPEHKKQIDKTYINWNKYAQKVNIKQKVLLTRKSFNGQKELLQFLQKDKYEIRVLEDIDFPANISLDVNSRYVSIFSTDPFQATVITDKKLIKILTEYHKYFWNRATELNI